MSQHLRGPIVPLVAKAAGSSPVSPTYSSGPVCRQNVAQTGPAQSERANREGVLRRSAAELARFWSYVDPSGPTPIHRPDLGPCWPWTGGKRGKGYGAFNMPKDGGGYRMVQAHRYAYEVSIAAVPGDLVVDHRCLNKPCCNPAHLEVVTNAENLRRGHSDRTTHCKNGHEFTPENTIQKATGPRACRACWLTLNELQREALGLLADAGGAGVCWTGATRVHGGRAWINRSTAAALERRGYVFCDGRGEGSPIHLTREAEAA